MPSHLGDRVSTTPGFNPNRCSVASSPAIRALAAAMAGAEEASLAPLLQGPPGPPMPLEEEMVMEAEASQAQALHKMPTTSIQDQ